MRNTHSFRERFLYHIWDTGHLRHKLKTVSGKEIEVLFPGQWNTDEGPDFLAAVVRIDTEVLHGDVEIHLRSSDWISHKHSENPAYHHVILHVVLDHDTASDSTDLPNGRQIDILPLKRQMDESLQKLAARYTDERFEPSDKSCELLGNLTDPHTFFENLGMVRLIKKSNRFATELLFNDFDQVLWQGLAESLGYSKNKFQMLELARAVPYDFLKTFKTQGKSRDAMLGTILGNAGLLEHLPSTYPMIWIAKWRELAEPAEIPIHIQWKLFRQRPINHPALRLMQVAQLLWDSFDTSLFHLFVKCFSQPIDSFSVSTVRERIIKLLADSQGWLPEKYHMGASRIDALIVNILLPLMLLFSRQKGYQDLQAAIEKSFGQYPPLDENRVIRTMRSFLPGMSPGKMSNVHQQGIIQLYSDFCRYHQCDLCRDAWSLYVKED